MSRSTFDTMHRPGSRRHTSGHSPTGSHGHRPTPHVEFERETALSRLTDLSLAGVILVVPFIMGGRCPLGEFVLVLLSVAAALCWSLSQLTSSRPQVRWSGVEILFVAAIGLGVLQLLPLDQQTLQNISPHIAELVPLRTPLEESATEEAATESAAESLSAALPYWTQLSLYPAATRQGLILFGAYALLFFVTLQRIRSGEDVERLLKLIAAAATLMAIFGLLQYFFGNGKFFWFFEHPQAHTSDFVKGAFSNRNHFAQFLALGVGPLLWLVLRLFDPSLKRSHSRRSSSDLMSLVVAVGLGTVMFAGLLSLSRGGAVALFAAVSVTLLLSLRAGILNARVVFSLAAAALFLGAGLFFYGQEKVGEKIDELLSGDLKKLDHEDGRIDLWKTVWDAGNKFPVVGAGIGSHRELYPAFQHVPAQHDFTHAENGYLQIFEETGSIGLGMMLFGILCCLFWTLRGSNPHLSSHAGCAAAIAGALAATTLHSLGDFVWYAPGIMAVVVVLAAASCRLAQLSREASGSGFFPRLASLGLLVAAVAGGIWSAPQLLARIQAEPHWNAYQKLAVVRPGSVKLDSEDEPPNPVPQIHALRKLVSANPEDARAHARLAQLYLIQFHLVQGKSENRMDVEQIRDAVRNSNFASVEKMNEWIDNAFGRPRKLLDLALHHCRESLKRSPLLGDNYLFYAKLRFLEHPQPEDLSPLWDQAVLLRPMDGKVLFNVGHEYALMLNNDKAYEFWQRAFRTGPNQQRRLIDILAANLRAQGFIEKFQPDVSSAFWLARKFQDLNEPEEYRAALEYYGRTSEEFALKTSDTQSARAWLGAFNVYKELENESEAVRCLKQALDADLNDYEVRFAAGQWALLHQDFMTAEEHLSWCAQRRPDNQELQSMVRQISHKTLDDKLVEPLSTEIESKSTSRFDSLMDDKSTF